MVKLPKLKIPASSKLLVVASVAALIALGLMSWSLFDPTVVPVMVSMSIGQGIGALSFALFLVVVLRDILSRSAPERLPHTPIEALRRGPSGEMRAVVVEESADGEIRVIEKEVDLVEKKPAGDAEAAEEVPTAKEAEEAAAAGDESKGKGG